LTGLGERAHQAGPNVNLSLHFQDSAQLLECEELEDVTLVGHSFGGKVIAGAASLVPQRVERLVYLDAHLATPGEAAVPDIRAAFGLAADRPVPATIAPIGDARMMGVTDPKQAAWVNRRMTPHPAGCFTQAYPADRVPPDRPRLYIRCRHDADEPPNVLTPFLQRVKSEPGWTLADLPTGHDAMVTMPVELASVLQGFG
jgi:pimeloyl-ACP methyl ester carboxylesterase